MSRTLRCPSTNSSVCRLPRSSDNGSSPLLPSSSAISSGTASTDGSLGPSVEVREATSFRCASKTSGLR